MGQSPYLFAFIFALSNQRYNVMFITKKVNNQFNKYPVPGFEQQTSKS